MPSTQRPLCLSVAAVVELLVVAAVVVVAAGVGLAVHVADVRRSTGDDDRSTVEGLDIADLSRPLLTLVALLLAFVLVQTFSSFQDASDSASEEATAVLSEAHAARRLTSESAVSIIGELRCYALAVAGPGWDALAATRRTSPVTEEANDRVEEALLAASEVAADQPALDIVLDADNARIAARRDRLNEAKPSVPTLVTVLLVVSVAITVGGSAALTNRRVRLPYSIPVLAATVVVFAGSLVVIIDLDRKFEGFARVEPVELRDVEQRLAELTGGVPPPCDERGNPTTG